MFSRYCHQHRDRRRKRLVGISIQSSDWKLTHRQCRCFAAGRTFVDVERCEDQPLAVSLCATWTEAKANRHYSKIRVIFLLSLGLFVMGMAIARCILSIGSSVEVALSSVWAQREAVSLTTFDMPHCDDI